MSDVERIPLAFHATDSADAIRQAKAWARAEPNLRLRTIADVVPSGQPGGNWTVTVVVNVLSRPVTTGETVELGL